MLLDSNIIIYATQPEYAWLREFIAEHEPAVSALIPSCIQTYHSLFLLPQCPLSLEW